MSPTLALVLVLVVVCLWCQFSGSKENMMSLGVAHFPLQPGELTAFEHVGRSLSRDLAHGSSLSPEKKKFYQAMMLKAQGRMATLTTTEKKMVQKILQKVVNTWNAAQSSLPVYGTSANWLPHLSL